MDVIIDATGVKSKNDGEYRGTKYGKVKIWEKIHIAIDRKSHRILNIEVTGNDVADPRMFIELMVPITEMNDVDSTTADGACDSDKNFEYCDKNGIKARIPVRINSVGGKSKYRRKNVVEQLGVNRKRGHRLHKIPPENIRRENQERWQNESGYHERSLVESMISVFKGAFGEYLFSKRSDMKEKELLMKAVVYNMFLV